MMIPAQMKVIQFIGRIIANNDNARPQAEQSHIAEWSIIMIY